MKITVEEVISQEFEVPDGTTLDDVRQMYKFQKLVLDSFNILETNVQMAEDESFITL